MFCGPSDLCIGRPKYRPNGSVLQKKITYRPNALLQGSNFTIVEVNDVPDLMNSLFNNFLKIGQLIRASKITIG